MCLQKKKKKAHFFLLCASWVERAGLCDWLKFGTACSSTWERGPEAVETAGAETATSKAQVAGGWEHRAPCLVPNSNVSFHLKYLYQTPNIIGIVGEMN